MATESLGGSDVDMLLPTRLEETCAPHYIIYGKMDNNVRMLFRSLRLSDHLVWTELIFHVGLSEMGQLTSFLGANPQTITFYSLSAPEAKITHYVALVHTRSIV